MILFIDLARFDLGLLNLEVDALSVLQILALHGATDSQISDTQLDRIASGFAASNLGRFVIENNIELIEVAPERMETAERRVMPKEERQMPTLGE